jgi:hypothetical protein
MLSRAFQYVANRNNFYNPWLNTNLPFKEVKADADVQRIRSLLLIDKDNLNSDYFVTAAVNVLISNTAFSHQMNLDLDVQPELWKKIQTERFKIKTPNWLLANSKEGTASVNRQVNTWPFDLTVTLKRLSDTEARISSGLLTEDIKAYFVNEKELQVDWPEWLKIRGTLVTEISEQWSNDSQVELFVPPSNYPVKEILDKLKLSSELITVLDKRNLLAYYSGADTSNLDKLSIIIYCLYQDTADKSN